MRTLLILSTLLLTGCQTTGGHYVPMSGIVDTQGWAIRDQTTAIYQAPSYEALASPAPLAY